MPPNTPTTVPKTSNEQNEQNEKTEKTVSSTFYKPPKKEDIAEAVKLTPKQKIDSLLEDIKSARKLAKEVGDKEKIPNEEEMKERLAGVSGVEFLNYSPEDLRLLFMEGNTVNFHGNDFAYRAIGAGDLFDRSTEYVKIDGIIGKRSQYTGAGYLNGKVGYVTTSGEYLDIDTGSKVESVKLEEVTSEEQKEFEKIQILSEEEEVKAKDEFKESFGENEKQIELGIESLNMNYSEIINVVADKYGVDPQLIRAVIQAESNWNPNAKSGKGAVGLMQMTPIALEEINRTSTTKFTMEDMADPAKNIEAGTRYLSLQLKQFHGREDLALAAYNCGPTKVRRELDAESENLEGGAMLYGEIEGRLPLETQNYVRKIRKFKSGYEDLSVNLSKGALSPKDMLVLYDRCRPGVSIKEVNASLKKTQEIALAVLKKFPNAKISSMARDVENNTKVNGAKDSDHIYGAAVDFVPPSQEIANFVKNKYGNDVFVLIHNKGTGAHVHVSFRPNGKKIGGTPIEEDLN